MPVFYTRDHEWVAVDGDVATIGITDYAQKQIGDILFVDVPPPGTMLACGREAALVESIKAAADIFSPVSGIVTASNDLLRDWPSLVNTAPEGDGWLFRVAISDPSELAGLVGAETYQARVKRL